MKTCAFAVASLAGLFAPAQAADKLPCIGYSMVRGPEATLDAVFMRELRDLGYEEGKNILIERRYTYNKPRASPTMAADLPVQQPTRYEMVINLKTAKTLGIAIPLSILLHTNEVTP